MKMNVKNMQNWKFKMKKICLVININFKRYEATESNLKSKLEHCIDNNYDGILGGPMVNEFHEVLKE